MLKLHKHRCQHLKTSLSSAAKSELDVRGTRGRSMLWCSVRFLVAKEVSTAGCSSLTAGNFMRTRGAVRATPSVASLIRTRLALGVTVPELGEGMVVVV